MSETPFAHPHPELVEGVGVSSGLGRLILSCLAEDRLVRPFAANLALGMSAAAGEPDAARPVVPTPAAVDTDRASRPGPPAKRALPTWLSLAAAAAVGGLVVLACVELGRGPSSAPPQGFIAESVAEPLFGVPSPEVPDGGVGEVALTSVVQAPRPGGLSYMLGLPMPKKALPGQKKPPCDPEYELAAIGACWAIFEKKPPCGDRGYEYAGKCVRASFDDAPQSTSDEPR